MKYRFLSSLDQPHWTYIPEPPQEVGGCAPSLRGPPWLPRASVALTAAESPVLS